MRRNNLLIILLILISVQVYSQDHKYPNENFYNRNIEVPIDYENTEEGTFTLYYQLTTNFDFSRPTIFFIYDSQQQYGAPGKVDELAQRYQFYESFNLVQFQNRGRQYSYIEVRNEDGTYNWEKAYRVFSSKQYVEDIERIRLDLFSEYPDKRIYLYGRSGGGYLVQEYLAKYSQNVKRAFIRCAPNPLIMKKLGYLESKYLYTSLNALDPALHDRLKAVLDKNIVPKLNLLWLLYRLEYAYENATEIQAKIINELHENKKDSYEEYKKQRGFDFSIVFGTEKEALERQMGIGLYLRPLECDGTYLLGPAPDYVDPIYACLRELSYPFIRLIEENIVEAPKYPSLKKFREIETEVFHLVAKNDHITPYQIGVELGNYLKNYEFFIAEDNHTLINHKDCYPLLRNAFFKYGIGSKELQEARSSIKCKEWKFK